MHRITFRQFWELSEIYTAPLNLFLILMGVSIAAFQYQWALQLNLLVYLAIIVMFHITVNIFNHYMDYQNASDPHYKEVTNIIGRDHLSLNLVRNLYLIGLGVSFILGLWLVWQTNLLVGFLGLLGFYIGLFYSYGKHPLNSLPIAEALTGTASGFFVPVLGFYLTLNSRLAVNFTMILQVFIICLPLVLMMFNNLLANNTCDLEEDIKNGRKTLVYYIGQKLAVNLLIRLYWLSYLLLPILVAFGIAPWEVLFLFLVLPKGLQGLKIYRDKQDKQRTFPIVLKTMASLMIGYPLLYFVGTILHLIFS